MNLFFGINNNILKSEIQIPLFKNKVIEKSKLKLFKCNSDSNEWKLNEVSNKNKINEFFYCIKGEDISNNDFFFLAQDQDLTKFNKKKLENLNNFTDTSPSFRANLKIYNKYGGFSSYQSDYPYRMTTKKGSICSSIYSLANKNAEKNYILLRNICENPTYENFNLYIVNYKLKKVEEKFEVKTNFTNFIEISNKLVQPNIYLATDNYLGIPMFVSEQNNSLSFEHTHPLPGFISGRNRFINIGNFKSEINEIIS
jgi:hypothetical protein